MVLTDEILQQLEQEDEQQAVCCQVSVHALSGKYEGESYCAKVVMVMLVDSGSSTSFISENMVQQLGLSVQPCESVIVKVAN